MRSYDAIVVGMGPAGSMAAYGMARSGLSVLAIDRESFPRFKSCGGCISTKIDRVLDFDLSPVVDDTVLGIDFTFKAARPLAITSDKPIAYNVRRDLFDHYLLRKAVDAGVEFISGERVTGCVDSGDSVEVTTADRSFKASFVVGADGAGGVIGRKTLGADYSNCHITITSEVAVPPETLSGLRSRCLVDFGSIPYGYGWIFPKENSLSVGIAGMKSALRRGIKDYFRNYAAGQPLLKGIDISETRGWSIPVYHGRGAPIAKGRALVAGDAAYLADPFLGEGIYYAMRSGQIAARAVAGAVKDRAASVERYGEMVARELYPDFKACATIVKLVYGYPRLWYRVVEMEPSIMQRYYDVLTGDESCEDFLKGLKSGIARKPWKAISRLLSG